SRYQKWRFRMPQPPAVTGVVWKVLTQAPLFENGANRAVDIGAACAGAKELFARFQSRKAAFEQLPLPAPGAAAANACVAEIAAVTANDDRKIKQHEIARRDLSMRWRPATLLAARAACEVAVQQNLLAGSFTGN